MVELDQQTKLCGLFLERSCGERANAVAMAGRRPIATTAMATRKAGNGRLQALEQLHQIEDVEAVISVQPEQKVTSEVHSHHLHLCQICA